MLLKTKVCQIERLPEPNKLRRELHASILSGKVCQIECLPEPNKLRRELHASILSGKHEVFILQLGGEQPYL